MKMRITTGLFVAGAAVAVAIGISMSVHAGAEEASPEKSSAATPGAEANCDAPLGWWESKGLEPLFINPEGGPPRNPCDFQVWSWTAFVHWTLIDADSGLARFQLLPTPADLAAGAEAKVGPRKLSLQPRDLKEEVAAGIDQAGPGGVIVDQNSRVAYYSTHMDPVYYAFAQKYYGKENYQKADPKLQFPIGSTVFKASWRVVQPGEDTSKLYTSKAEIAEIVNKDGKAVASGKMIPDQTVALVGLHVVGVIKDHPEFAWATFEHDDNAPSLPPGGDPKSPDPVSDKNFAFYKAGTPAANCNPTDAEGMPVTVTVSDVEKQTLTPITNIFLQFRFGGASKDIAAQIASSNDNFREGIIANSKSIKELDAVFANYFLVGTVWQKANSLEPDDGDMSSTALGSPSLMNSTLETYVQGKSQNCFECHNTAGYSSGGKPVYPGKDINLSHVLLGPFFGD